MTRDLRIRAAQPADWPAIAEVLEACGLASDDLDPSLALFHIAVLDGGIVGCAGAEGYGDTVVVRSVAVLPPYRDRGNAPSCCRNSRDARTSGGKRSAEISEKP